MSSLNTTDAPSPGPPVGLATGTPAPDFALMDENNLDAIAYPSTVHAANLIGVGENAFDCIGRSRRIVRRRQRWRST